MLNLYIGLYLLVLFAYFFTRVSDNKVYRIINKYLLASMYLGLAIYIFFRDHDFVSYQTLLMAALFLAWLGDIFLVFDFGRGGDFFLAGNVCFILYEQIILVENGHDYRDFYWVFIIVAVLLTAFNSACKKWPETFKLGKMRLPMTFYLSSILTHGFTGLTLMIYLPGSRFALMGLGSVLFMISDMILTACKFIFGGNKWLIRANSLFYFCGIMLIVLSTIR